MRSERNGYGKCGMVREMNVWLGERWREKMNKSVVLFWDYRKFGSVCEGVYECEKRERV